MASNPFITFYNSNNEQNLIVEGFVYCWTDHLTNKLYIGVHKGSPDDGYLCSSKIVKEYLLERRNDFTREIIASGKYDDMRKLETAILKSCDAARDSQFYNQHNGCKNFYLKHQTKEARRKIAIARTGVPRSPETIEKMRNVKHSEETKKKISENHHDVSGKNNPMYGKKHTENAKKTIGEKNKIKLTGIKRSDSFKENLKQPKTEEHKKKISKALSNLPKSDEHKRKLSESIKNAPRKMCQKCKKWMAPSNYTKHMNLNKCEEIK